ncbi:alpha/beta hydrolase [Ktedonosporobacter rubrisoli]|uniref:Alpha/beta hydrolase n=1 Tax=Ktedonosporobacter rubrisoli TaxID=2509675 RepID=A0A4V0YZL6_KTERU|nr:alpha/beta hydrolase [Ktedonosporobacter rubrisoli]QBD80151.1 alpha/beta hydrolase [Ktedonosporobacter rubrisoli]
MSNNISNVVGSPERRTGRSVHYTLSYLVQGEEHGRDGAIVLLHDIPAGAFAWEEVMPRLAGLNRAVYAFDMLGFGESDHPWPADTSVWGQADVLSFLLEKLNLTNIILVGHGLGGGVAQVLATRLYREQTAALVLIDSICYLYTFAENWPLPEMEKRQDFDAPKHTSLEDVIRDLRTTLPHAVQNIKGFDEVLDKYVEPWDSEVGKEVLYQHIRLLIPYYLNSVATDLGMAKKPTLLIWGEKDQQIPLQYAERLHREIAGSRLVTIPDAGHLTPFDAPASVANTISDFIKGL